MTSTTDKLAQPTVAQPTVAQLTVEHKESSKTKTLSGYKLFMHYWLTKKVNGGRGMSMAGASSAWREERDNWVGRSETVNVVQKCKPHRKMNGYQYYMHHTRQNLVTAAVKWNLFSSEEKLSWTLKSQA
jgi:hypothetical protein